MDDMRYKVSRSASRSCLVFVCDDRQLVGDMLANWRPAAILDILK